MYNSQQYMPYYSDLSVFKEIKFRLCNVVITKNQYTIQQLSRLI